MENSYYLITFSKPKDDPATLTEKSVIDSKGKQPKDNQGNDQLVKPQEKLHYKWSIDGKQCIVHGEITPEFKQWIQDNAAQVLYLGNYNPITGHAENSVYEFIKSHSSEWDSVVKLSK